MNLTVSFQCNTVHEAKTTLAVSIQLIRVLSVVELALRHFNYSHSRLTYSRFVIFDLLEFWSGYMHGLFSEKSKVVQLSFTNHTDCHFRYFIT